MTPASSPPGGVAWRLALAALVLSASRAATPCLANPQEVDVRLDWLRPPARIEIEPLGPGARVRMCPPCRTEPLAGTARLTADGGRLVLDRGRRRGGAAPEGAMRAEISGEFVLKGASNDPLRLRLPSPLGVRAEGGRLLLTARLPLEDYVASVLAGESGGFVSEEGLKAMAVAARTFAARFRGRHGAEGFDFCDTTHCQDLRLAAVTDRMRAAAQATEGELLWWEGEPAATYYHADCGGETEEARNVWGGPRLPSLRRIADPYCTVQGRREWSAELTEEEMRRTLDAAGLRVPGGPRAIEVADRTPSGRARTLRLRGSKEVIVPASQLRFQIGRTIGWDRIKSDLYDVRREGDLFLFHGYGAGHGVGLCQAGADRMGESGRDYRDILAHYYPGTTLGLTAGGLTWQALGGERVDLLTTRPADDGPLVALADRLVREAEARSGWTLGRRPRITVFPSVAVFRNATGEPGWVAASTKGGVTRLQPAATLRARGSLESTVRHEMLHLLVEDRADPATPLWYREGVVLHLAGAGRETRQRSHPTAVDPAKAGPPGEEGLDRALRHPAGPEEMRRSYADALARVESLVAAHGEARVLAWLERGGPPLPGRRGDDRGRLRGPAGAPDQGEEDQPGSDQQ